MMNVINKDCQRVDIYNILREPDAHLILTALLERPKNLTDIVRDVLPEQREKMIYVCPDRHVEKEGGKSRTYKRQFTHDECPDGICPHCRRKKTKIVRLRVKEQNLGRATNWTRRARPGILVRMLNANIIMAECGKGREIPYRINWEVILKYWIKDVEKKIGCEQNIDPRELQRELEEHHSELFSFRMLEALLLRSNEFLPISVFGAINIGLYYAVLAIFSKEHGLIDQAGLTKEQGMKVIPHARLIFINLFSMTFGIPIEEMGKMEDDFHRQFMENVHDTLYQEMDTSPEYIGVPFGAYIMLAPTFFGRMFCSADALERANQNDSHVEHIFMMNDLFQALDEEDGEKSSVAEVIGAFLLWYQSMSSLQALFK